jgi:hypothetical protein
VTLLHTSEQAVELAEIAAEARDYVAASRAENTTRVYRTGWEGGSAFRAGGQDKQRRACLARPRCPNQS